MIIRYSDRSFAEGIIHSIDGGTIRAVVAGCDDAVEYRLMENQWTSEAGAIVTFESYPQSHIDPIAIFPNVFTPTEAGCIVGGNCMLRHASLLDAGAPDHSQLN